MAMSSPTRKPGNCFVKTRDEVFRNLARGSFDEEEFSRAPDDDGYCYLTLYEPGIMRARAAHHLGPYPTWRSVKQVGIPKTSSAFRVRERQGYVHVSPSRIGHRLQDLVIADDARMGSCALVSEAFSSWLSNLATLLCCIYLPGYYIVLTPFVASAICMAVYVILDAITWLYRAVTSRVLKFMAGTLKWIVCKGSLGFTTSLMGMFLFIRMGTLGVGATNLVDSSTPLNSNFETFGPIYDWNDAFDVAFDYIVPSTSKLCLSDDEVRYTILALDIDHGKEKFFRHICPNLGEDIVWLEEGLVGARRYFRKRSGGLVGSSFERAKEDFRRAMGSMASTTVDAAEAMAEEVSKIKVGKIYRAVRDEVYDTGTEVFKDVYTPKEVVEAVKDRGRKVIERSHGLDDVVDLAFDAATLGKNVATELLADGGLVVEEAYESGKTMIGSTRTALQDYTERMIYDVSAEDASTKTKEILRGIVDRAGRVLDVGDGLANKIVNTNWRDEGVNAIEHAPWATKRIGSTLGGFLSGFSENVGINITDLVVVPSVSNVKGLREALFGNLPESFGKWWSTDVGYRRAPLFTWGGGRDFGEETGSLMTMFVMITGLLGLILVYKK